jgi:hypothetical protein
VLFAEEGESVWLYLTDVDSLRPVADCWMFNTIPAPDDLHSFKTAGGPPPATRQFVGPDAQCKLPDAQQVHFRWSPDGHSVAAYIRDELLGFIAHGHKAGYSKHLLIGGPFGAPLDNDLFEALFS